MGKWTKQEMKRTQWPGMWQQMVASCKDAQESKLLRPSVTVCSVPQLWGDVPAPSLPPGTVPTTFKVGDKGLLTEWRARETRQEGHRAHLCWDYYVWHLLSDFQIKEEEVGAFASCPETEFTMSPMSLNAMCSIAIKVVREKLIFNQ